MTTGRISSSMLRSNGRLVGSGIEQDRYDGEFCEKAESNITHLKSKGGHFSDIRPGENLDDYAKRMSGEVVTYQLSAEELAQRFPSTKAAV